jgi:glycosyltransferase involved in cell wall biosynthesis
VTAAKKRLLILGALPPPVNGAAKYFETLLKTRVADEFDIIFLNLRFVKSIDDYGRFSTRKAFIAIKYALRLVRILTWDRIDLVYSAVSFTRVSFTKDMVLTAICRLFGRRVVGCILGIGLEDLYTSSGAAMRWFIRRGLTLYEAFITPSLRMHERYFASLIPVAKAREVAFGVFADGSAPDRSLAANRTVQILYYSNFVRAKGIDEALGAVPIVIRRHADVRFLFVGAWDSEAHRRAVMPLAEADEMKERVKFTGIVSGDARRACLQESDIFLLPTYYPNEGMPLALLEAMSYGCAIVTTDHAAISSVVEEGVSGLFCRAGDIEDLAGRIVQLLDDQHLLRRLQQGSARRFREDFTAQRFGERLTRELGSLMRRRRDDEPNTNSGRFDDHAVNT